MIISIPLDLPKLEPDDWEKWWWIWNTYAVPLVKIRTTFNFAGLHIGIDVFRLETCFPTYMAPFVDLEVLYPSLYDQILSLPTKMRCARFVQSYGDFSAHIDDKQEAWAIRSMFYCADPAPQWYYTDMNNENKKYLKLPEDTNWWVYRDGIIKHGTDYRSEFPKIILQIYTEREPFPELIEASKNKFQQYAIEYDISN